VKNSVFFKSGGILCNNQINQPRQSCLCTIIICKNCTKSSSLNNYFDRAILQRGTLALLLDLSAGKNGSCEKLSQTKYLPFKKLKSSLKVISILVLQIAW